MRGRVSARHTGLGPNHRDPRGCNRQSADTVWCGVPDLVASLCRIDLVRIACPFRIRIERPWCFGHRGSSRDRVLDQHDILACEPFGGHPGAVRRTCHTDPCSGALRDPAYARHAAAWPRGPRCLRHHQCVCGMDHRRIHRQSCWHIGGDRDH